MDLEFAGETALVTASSGGIGEAIAAALAREGARVIVNGRTEDNVAAAMSRIQRAVGGALLEPLALDLGTPEGCAAAPVRYPKVDILVNNLGIYEPTDFFETSDEQWQHLFEVNVMSGVRLARTYMQGMLERDAGRVIFVASEAAVNPAPEMAHYSSTKTMQLSLSRNLAELTKGRRVTVNAVLPGPVATEGAIKFIGSLFPELEAQAAQRKFMAENRPTSLLQRLTLPSEIADFVAFIASGKASAVNGAALRVDGGMIRSVI